MFKQLIFNREREFTYKNTIDKSKWEFFIPGVNSGSYKPASLHVEVITEETFPGFFKFKTKKCSANITLTAQEFDLLFEEMKKIKTLRDDFIKVKEEKYG